MPDPVIPVTPQSGQPGPSTPGMESVMREQIAKMTASRPQGNEPPKEAAQPGEPAPQPHSPAAGPVPDDFLDLMKPAEPAKPAEPQPGDQRIDESKLAPEVRVNLGNLRRSYEGRIRDMESELSRLKTAAPQAEANANEVKALKEQIGRLSLESDPAFKARYDAVRDAQVKQAAKVVSQLSGKEIKPSVLDTLIDMDPADRMEMVPQLFDEKALPFLAQFYAQLDMLETDRKVTLDNWQQRQAELNDRRQREDSQRASRITGAIQDQAFTAVAARLPFFRETQKTGAEAQAWNQGVQHMRDAAVAVMHSGDPQAIAEAVVMGSAAPAISDMLNRAWGELRELRRIVAERGIMVPRNGERPPGDGQQRPPQAGQPMTADKAVASLQARMQQEAAGRQT